MPAAKVCPSTALKEQSLIPSQNVRSLRSEPTNESDDNSDNFTSERKGLGNCRVVYCNSRPNETKVTPYQRILRSLNTDERWQREITLGRRIGFYRFRGEIGSGNFSQVKVAIHCLTKDKVAVKILDKCKLDSKTRTMLLREISSMEDMHHPNIIRIFEVIETFTKIYLVMEYAPNGELFQIITRDGRLEESEAKPLFAQIVAAIDHMHFHNIIHRDIKAENVFYADFKTVKVGDFGFSTRIDSKEQLLSTFCGSPPYAAPELFHEESYLGPYVDYWALGILLYFMVTALMPFKAQTISSLKKLILDGIYEIPEYVSKECSFAIKGLLQQNPNKRFNLNELRDSEWLSGQIFPKYLPKYELKVSESASKELNNNNNNNNNNNFLSPQEKDTYKQLTDLGITENLICDNIDKGSRSDITGTFRIILHRFINSDYKRYDSTQRDENTNDQSSDPNIKINTNGCINTNIETKGNTKSSTMTKSIKSLKNIFIDKSLANTELKKGEHYFDNGTTPAKPIKKYKKSRACNLL